MKIYIFQDGNAEQKLIEAPCENRAYEYLKIEVGLMEYFKYHLVKEDT